MFARRRKIIPASAPVVLLLALVVWLTTARSLDLRFSLPDGSNARLTDLNYGKELRFFNGAAWQKPIYRLLRNWLPGKWVGTESTWTSSHPEGSIGLTITRSFSSKPSPAQISNYFLLTTLNETGDEELLCNQLAVGIQKGIGPGRIRITGEQSFWELPFTGRKHIRLKLYFLNRDNTPLVAKEFIIPNPNPIK